MKHLLSVSLGEALGDVVEDVVRFVDLQVECCGRGKKSLVDVPEDEDLVVLVLDRGYVVLGLSDVAEFG